MSVYIIDGRGALSIYNVIAQLSGASKVVLLSYEPGEVPG
jgi:hypothetical protein